MYLQDRIDKFNNTKTPFYYYDMELLNQTLEVVKSESEKYDYKIMFAIKSNTDERLLRTVASYGFGADCVSGGEIVHALKCGFENKQIAYAGVGKRDEEIELAIENDIFSFNCESLEELEVINSIAQKMNKVARVALRLNPEVDPHTHAYITTGKSENKFGIAFSEIGQFVKILPTLSNLHICGLHFHIGSQILHLEVFEELCKRVSTFIEWFESNGIKIESLNMGGGLGIDYENPDNTPIAPFQEYFKIFDTHLPKKDGRTVHFELGRSIIGQCGTLVTKALFNKTTTLGKKYVIIDGSMTELLRPALYGAYHKIQNITSQSNEEFVYDVAGGVCESSDILGREVTLPQTKRGDYLIIRSAGAYGSSMSSNYNLHTIPKSIYSDNI